LRLHSLLPLLLRRHCVCRSFIPSSSFFFFFNDTATTEIYTLSLHDALPIYFYTNFLNKPDGVMSLMLTSRLVLSLTMVVEDPLSDRKSTRLNSSHVKISYAVFCLKKKKKTNTIQCHASKSSLSRSIGKTHSA